MVLCKAGMDSLSPAFIILWYIVAFINSPVVYHTPKTFCSWLINFYNTDNNDNKAIGYR